MICIFSMLLFIPNPIQSISRSFICLNYSLVRISLFLLFLEILLHFLIPNISSILPIIHNILQPIPSNQYPGDIKHIDRRYLSRPQSICNFRYLIIPNTLISQITIRKVILLFIKPQSYQLQILSTRIHFLH